MRQVALLKIAPCVCTVAQSGVIAHALLFCYHGTWVPYFLTTMKHLQKFVVQRVQTGVRMEKRLLKVLKALAEFHDLTLGDLLEGIVLHAFDGKVPFERSSRRRIKELKRFYGLDLDARASHRLTEARQVSRARGSRAAQWTAARREMTKAERAPAKKGRALRSLRSIAQRKVKKRGGSR